MLPTLSPQEFVAKWSQIRLKEMTVAQSHFIDVCALVDHSPPLDADPHGQFFTFEASTEKTGGQRGRADVWYKGRFIWEYKGAHADLDKAYQQLLLYRESLGNPPLLITSDTQRIIIHTNFTNTVKRVYEIDFERLLKGDGLALLKRAFHDPQSLEPDQTQEQVTRATVNMFVTVVDTLKKWERAADPERLGHFIVRLFFCLFAEDLGLLPGDVFTQLVGYQERGFRQFVSSLRALFAAMRDGGTFGFYPSNSRFGDWLVPAGKLAILGTESCRFHNGLTKRFCDESTQVSVRRWSFCVDSRRIRASLRSTCRECQDSLGRRSDVRFCDVLAERSFVASIRRTQQDR